MTFALAVALAMVGWQWWMVIVEWQFVAMANSYNGNGAMAISFTGNGAIEKHD